MADLSTANRRRLGMALAILATLFLLGLVAFQPALAVSTPDCAGFDHAISIQANGTSGTSDGVTVTVVYTANKPGEPDEKTAFTWSTSPPTTINKIVIKAGNDPDVVLTPNSTSGSGAVQGDNAISHISFCWNDAATTTTAAPTTTTQAPTTTTAATTTTEAPQVLPTVITQPPGDQGGPPPGGEEGPNVLPRVVRAAPQSQPAAQTLPFTGGNPVPFVIAAGLLMATGGGLLLSARRRSRT